MAHTARIANLVCQLLANKTANQYVFGFLSNDGRIYACKRNCCDAAPHLKGTFFKDHGRWCITNKVDGLRNMQHK